MSPPTNVHAEILALGSVLGYGGGKGVCHGTTLAWIMASMVNKEAQFNKRISRIVEEAEALPKKIEQRGSCKIQKCA